MIELQEVITTKLSTLASRAYCEEAAGDAVTPYVVFHLPTSVADYQREDFTLDVVIWDFKRRNGYDPDDIDTITSAIDGDGHVFNPTGMNRFNIFIPGLIQVKFYRVNRLAVPDPDLDKVRRQLIYNARVYLL